MATIRTSIREKIRNLDYGIPVQHSSTTFSFYWTRLIQWISSLGILFSLLVGIGNGDVGNNDTMSRISVPASIYTLYDDMKFPQMRHKWNN